MNNNQRFFGPNAGYVAELYEEYLRDPASVDPASRAAFERFGPPVAAQPATQPAEAVMAAAAPTAPAFDLAKAVATAELARSIRSSGHLAAQVSPLAGAAPALDPVLDPAAYGLSETDLAALPASVAGGPAAQGQPSAREAIAALRRIYCGVTGYEYSHLTDPAERAWWQEAVESAQFHHPLSHPAQRALLERLTLVDAFERVMHQAFPGQTRFSIEGLDMMVPMLDEVARLSAAAGATQIMLGMAHRGRLNVLAHIMGKSYAEILSEFRRSGQNTAAEDEADLGAWMGDVKYHLGGGNEVEIEGRRITIAMAPNPSHLEYVNPVIEGMVRAGQEERSRPGWPARNPDAGLAVQIHGDAAFPGQGINAETLNLAGLPGYTTGGTLHIIANNQLGFTTEPEGSRTTRYASDNAKGYGVPVIHVNADQPDACLAAVRISHAYRQQFHRDVLVDLIGYRRWGHNEGDDPAFTQPELYEGIQAHPTVRELWARQAVAGGALTQDEAGAMSRAVTEQMQQIRTASAAAGERHGFVKLTSFPMLEGIATAVPAATLQQLNQELLNYPAGFEPNPRVARQIERRRTALGPEAAIDWGHAESLAFASILAGGTPIRITGQDTERGTFSQRHAVLHSGDGQTYTPLQGFAGARASFAIYNSPLSENATLGFEFGYSVTAPEALVLWEGQYGDFVNGAQVVIDQFIAAARSKWGQTPALVLLLPHGYEGAGPEHSSGRLERFLQLAADDNLRVANCTTAAQYFHLLRRQAALLEHDPRPLVVMTPKSLLRLPRSLARLEDLADGSFQTVMNDEAARERAAAVTRVVLCSGKVYYDLAASEARAAAGAAALVRVEELYPFPAADLARVLAGYPHLREVIWVQEEPKNMGAWGYMAPKLRALVDRGVDVAYVGRVERSSPAEGSPGRHRAEQDRIVRAAFNGVSAPQKGSRRESHAG